MTRTMTQTAMPQKAGRKEWLGLAVLALPTLLVSLDLFLLILAMPSLSEGLHASSVQQLWILDIYGFLLSGFMVTMGSWGDRIGHRKVLLWGAAAFGLASVACAFSTTPLMLIVARAALGIAGATLAPSILALIRNMFPDERQRALAIGIWLVCFTSGAILGPLVGGVVLEHFWWGSVFLLGLPAMVLLLALGPKLLPERREGHGGPLDMPSVGLSLAAILSVIYGVKELVNVGLRLVPVLTIVLGLVAGTAFLKRQRRLEQPLIDLRLFRRPTFSVALGSLLANSMLTGAIMVFVIQHFQLVEALPPLNAALWIIPGMATSIISIQVSPMIARRVRPAVLIAYSLILTVIGLIWLTQADGVVGLALGFAVVNLGSGPLIALSTHLVLSTAPPELAGAAGALNQTSGYLGLSLGIALLGSLGTVVYRAQLADHLRSLPTAAADTARGTLAGATTVAGGLPHNAGAVLLDQARAAFTSGLHIIAAISAVLMAATAVVVLVTLQQIKPLGQTEQS